MVLSGGYTAFRLQVQILEMALAEAGRRVAQTSRCSATHCRLHQFPPSIMYLISGTFFTQHKPGLLGSSPERSHVLFSWAFPRLHPVAGEGLLPAREYQITVCGRRS